VQQIADQLMTSTPGAAPDRESVISQKKGEFVDLQRAIASGHGRSCVHGEQIQLSEPPILKSSAAKHDISVVADRPVAADDILKWLPRTRSRDAISDSRWTGSAGCELRRRDGPDV
jgi:excinuclease ABC subunit A